jgi:tRNA-guanine family transglycosylase
MQISTQDGAARLGRISTAHGVLDTPTVFPVHNLGDTGGWNTPRYWEIFPRIQTAMFNAYHIMSNRRLVRDKIRAAGGIHRFLGFKGAAFVDSGGFLNLNSKVETDQVSLLNLQEGIGADIASTLDFPCNMRLNQRIYDKIRKSVINAYEAGHIRKRKEMLLYASVHGNDSLLLRNVLRFLSKSGAFDGYAIGGLLPVRSDFRFVIDLIVSLRRAISEEPIHIFGLGGPLTIPILAYLGVDSFDSSSFIVCGSRRVYFVPGDREIRLKDMPKNDRLPCNCVVCRANSLEEIRRSRSLIALHNLWVVWSEIDQVRLAIAEERLEAYLRWRYSRNPLMRDVFDYAKRRLKNILR